MSAATRSRRGRCSPIRSPPSSVDTIHLAIGSHRHKDHIGAMDNVMAAIPTARYVGDTSSYARGEDDDNLRAAIVVRELIDAGERVDRYPEMTAYVDAVLAGRRGGGYPEVTAPAR